MQAYSNPKRESDPHALPDLEVWSEKIDEILCRCGVYDAPQNDEHSCPSCGSDDVKIFHTERVGWFYWFCFPGCLPEGGPNGPFENEADALADAREGVCDDDESEVQS